MDRQKDEFGDLFEFGSARNLLILGLTEFKKFLPLGAVFNKCRLFVNVNQIMALWRAV